jgi:hypothetical protein
LFVSLLLHKIKVGPGHLKPAPPQTGKMPPLSLKGEDELKG